MYNCYRSLEVTGNTIMQNTHGIIIEQSNNITIDNNYIAQNFDNINIKSSNNYVTNRNS